jgi:hypothetical protein
MQENGVMIITKQNLAEISVLGLEGFKCAAYIFESSSKRGIGIDINTNKLPVLHRYYFRYLGLWRHQCDGTSWVITYHYGARVDFVAPPVYPAIGYNSMSKSQYRTFKLIGGLVLGYG